MPKPKTIRAAAKQTDVIAMLADVSIEAASGDEKGPAKFDVVAYTGIPLTVDKYDLPVVVDLSTLSATKSVVANLDHNSQHRVGNVTAQTNDGKTLRLSGTASAATPYRDEVVASAASGFQWQASIEARPGKLEKVAAGKTVSVNGQQHAGPIYVARNSTLKGFAFVSHGADDNTTVNIAASAADTLKEKNMDKELQAWIESLGFVVAELSDTQIEGLKANYHGKPTPKKPAAKLDDVLATYKAENERLEKIASITDTMLEKESNNAVAEQITALARLAVDSKWTPDQFELELLRASRPQSHTVFRRRGGEENPNSKQAQLVIEAAICKSGGLSGFEKKFDEQTLDAMDKKFPHGIGLQQMLIISARAKGYQGDSICLEAQRAAFADVKADGYSTLSVPGILSNTANKFLIEGWMSVEDSWRQIAAIRSVRDFKTVTSYSLTGAFSYDKVGPAGELKHGTVGELSYTNRAETYGKMFAITRQDIINDDLSALTAVPRRLGRGAGLKFNDVFWTEFLASHTSTSWFPINNANGNYIEGATTASVLSIDTLSLGETAFYNQTDADSKPLGISPEILLVPNALATKATTLMSDTEVRDTTSSTKYTTGNPHAGKWRVVRSSYLSNSAMAGSYSTTAWYLLANPMNLAFIEACFLNGNQSPTVESADADFNTLGIQMRGYHDFGVAKQEYRAAFKSKGAA